MWDVACCVSEIQNAQRIVAMPTHKPLNPLRSILESTDLLGSLYPSPSHLCARLIGKGGGIGHTRKIGEVARHDHVFVLALALFNRANRHQFHLCPYPSY
jgi:hypothetical protein